MRIYICRCPNCFVKTDDYQLTYLGPVTGINGVTNTLYREQNVIYDLTGRRVNHPTKGLYIVNGKKVKL